MSSKATVITGANGRPTLRILKMIRQELTTMYNNVVAAEKHYQIQLSDSRLTTGVYFLGLEFDGIFRSET